MPMEEIEKVDYSEYSSTRSESKLTPYQRQVGKIENVILCVAEAEKMVAEVGRSLLTDVQEKQPAPADNDCTELSRRQRPDSSE